MTKRELSQLYYLNREIDRECARLAQLEAAATSTTSTISGLPHAGTISDKTAIAAAIADSRQVIQNTQRLAVVEYNRLMRYIADIDDSFIRQIIRARYVDGKSWQAVAEVIGGNNTADSVRMAHNRYLKSENDNNARTA